MRSFVLAFVLVIAAATAHAPTDAAGGSDQGLRASARSARADSVLVCHPMADFGRATAVSVDPGGSAWVADAESNSVVRVAPDGTVNQVIGSAGARQGEFDGPTDVDATNGLILIVADAGNGRIQRFTHDGRFLESLPVSIDPRQRAGSVTLMQREAGVVETGDGRPIRIVEIDAGRLLAIEQFSSTIRIWDRDRRFAGTTGAAAGDPFPVEPVALATDGNHVYVADPGLPGVAVLDTFGRPSRVMGRGVADSVRSLAVGAGRLWAATPTRLHRFTTAGIFEGSFRPGVEGSIVDLAWAANALYVLSARTLYRCPAR